MAGFKEKNLNHINPSESLEDNGFKKEDESFKTPEEAYQRIKNQLLSLMGVLFDSTDRADPDREVNGFLKLVREIKSHIDGHSLEYLKENAKTRNQIKGAVWAITEVGQKIIDQLGTRNLPNDQLFSLTKRINDEVDEIKSREKLAY